MVPVVEGSLSRQSRRQEDQKLRLRSIFRQPRTHLSDRAITTLWKRLLMLRTTMVKLHRKTMTTRPQFTLC